MKEGRKREQDQNIIHSNLTRRYCVSKLAEVFDLTSKIKSIIATTKMDLNNLLHRGRENHKSVKNEFKIEYCKYSDS